MPCYNSAPYIKMAIESILNQTHENLELIIINDGSTDNSQNEIMKFSDKRIFYSFIKKNKGNYAARNQGFKIAKGKYIAVMDADDISEPSRLACQFDFLERDSKVGCLGSCGIAIDSFGNPLQVIGQPLGYAWIRVLLLKNNYTIHPSLMFRKSTLQKHNLYYDENFTYSSDYDFVVRCSQKFHIKSIPNTLIKYRRHATQISSLKFKEQSKFADIIRLNQLKRFEINLSTFETNLYLQMLNKKINMNKNIEGGIEILNKVLESNYHKRLYNQHHLFSLFEYIKQSSCSEVK